MHPTAQSFAERARERFGIDVTVREFEEETSTAAEAATAIGCDVEQVANSIALVVEGESADVAVGIVSGAERVSLEKFAAVRDAAADDVRIASPSEVKETLGWSIGGVPPLGYETDVPVVVDQSLLAFDTIWGGAGTPSAMVALDPEIVTELNDATTADISES